MARGWESKSVESQQEERLRTDRVSRRKAPSPEQVELDRKRDSLLLSRKRVLHDLEHSHHPGYQKILKESLAFLDQQLAALS